MYWGTGGAGAPGRVSISWVSNPPPTCTLTTDWDPINRHVGTIMRWSTTNATSFSVNNGVGSLAPVAGGNVNVYPQTTTTYTGTATGAGGTITCTKTANVTPDPTGTLTLDDDTIAAGESTTLRWSTANAHSVFIMSDEGSGQFPTFGGSGAVSATGASSVSPGVSTTYTMYVYDREGDSSPLVVTTTLTVTSCSVSFGQNPIAKNQSTTLSYSSTNTASFSIANVGPLTPNTSGQRSVSPSASTDYTGTAIGSATYGAPVTVTLTSGSSWTVPANWNSAGNTITIKGGDGGGTGAGTGQTQTLTNISLTPGAAITYGIGTGGAAGSAGNPSYWNGASCGGASACGTGGAAGTAGGSATYSAPTTTTFYIPIGYSSLTARVWGGGGGGGVFGSGSSYPAGSPGGTSQFHTIYAYGGSGGKIPYLGGSPGGTSSGGTENIQGAAGSQATRSPRVYADGGLSPNGGAGGAGAGFINMGNPGNTYVPPCPYVYSYGGTWWCFTWEGPVTPLQGVAPGGGGGSTGMNNIQGGGGGGYSSRTYAAGSLLASVTLSVGAGGAGVPLYYHYSFPLQGASGAPGRVEVTWTGGGSSGANGSITITYTPIVEAASIASCPATLTVQCTSSSTYSCSGTAIVRTTTNADCSTTTDSSYATCTAPSFCADGSALCLYPNPSFTPGPGTLTGHLQVRPTLVRAGQTAKVYWNLANVQSCTVTGDNGDSWTGASSGASGKITSPITRTTTYSLSCTAYPGATPATITESGESKDRTVRITPTFRER